MRVRFPSPAPVRTEKRVVLNTSQKLILGAAVALFATGTVLAVAQPGDLGESDADTAAPVAATTTTTLDDEASTTSTVGETTTTTTTVSAAPGGDAGGTTSTSQPGSGIGAAGAGSAGDDIADTGHESMLAGGLLLLGAGLVLRRAAH